MNEQTITLNISRYRPGEDSEPVVQSFQVPYHEDWVVLDALNYIKDEIDGSLSFRWSCHMGVCGSCGMTVNGEPKLTCSSFLRDYFPHAVNVGPLANFPVMRDLVVDMSDFLDKLKSVSPWIVRKEKQTPEQGENLQTPAQLDRFRQFTQCINCMLCYSACPVYAHESDFIGPAALALAYRYNEDSRDEGEPQRRAVTNTHDGTWQCTFVGQCSVACPKHVDPAAAIQRMKAHNAKSWVQSLLLPKGGA